MIRKAWICLLIIFCSWQRALAIDAVVFHSLFYLSDPAHANKVTPSVETYWQIKPQSLHYVTTPQKMIVAHIKTDIYLMNDTGIIKEDHFILETVPRANVSELMTHSIIDLRRYFITNGTIKMRFRLTDMADSLHHFTYSDSFVVAPPVTTAFYSDLQLLDTIIKSPAQTLFNKNGRQQVPACTNFLDDSKNILHYYAELYNTNQLSPGDLPLTQTVYITRKETDNPAGALVRTDTVTAGKLALVSGNFDISSLASGNYYLNVRLENKAHATIASGNFFFQRLNLHPAAEKIDTSKKKVAKPAVSDTGIESINVVNLDKTFLAKYTLAEIRAILKMLLPVSNPAETHTIKNFLKKPDEIYMRYFILNYFTAIDKKDPGHAWKEYADKVREVNRRFTAYGTNGYETDRGFIFLRYGPPTEIVTVENEQGTLPYEIWQYNNLTQTNRKEVANALFLFYTIRPTLTDFTLLHSTVDGEAQNPSWRSYLYTNSQGGANTNSRAEQYFGTTSR